MSLSDLIRGGSRRRRRRGAAPSAARAGLGLGAALLLVVTTIIAIGRSAGPAHGLQDRANDWLGRFGVPFPVAELPAPEAAISSASGPGALTEESPSEPGSFYDVATVRTISIRFPNDAWERDMARLYRSGEEILAEVTIDGQSFRDVGVRFRGNSSFRRVQEGSKRPLRLKLDLMHDQDVGGYRTLNLLNGMNDPTFVRPVLYSHIAGHYIPTAKANFARVEINGENWGVYVSLQQFNKDFLSDFFDTTEGARWKAPGSPRGRAGLEYLGQDVAAYRRFFEIKSKDDPARWADLIELTRVLNETPLEQLQAALEPILDVDGALRFLALEMALVNSDGYWTRASDYNLYQDPGGRFHIIPHDINEALGVSGNVRLNPLTGLSDPSKPLRSRLLAVPVLRERYLEYVREIAEHWLDWNTLGPLVAQHQALIAEDVRADTRKLYGTEAFDAGVEIMKSFVDGRRAYLLE